jgi:hypothetical protein
VVRDGVGDFGKDKDEAQHHGREHPADYVEDDSDGFVEVQLIPTYLDMKMYCSAGNQHGKAVACKNVKRALETAKWIRGLVRRGDGIGALNLL